MFHTQRLSLLSTHLGRRGSTSASALSAPQRIKAFLLVALSLSIAPPTLAQGVVQAQNANEGSDMVVDPNEVVVTARRVSERLQDVPLAVSAFTADDIARRQLDSIKDIALFTPGLAFEDFGSTALKTPTIRGIASTNLANPVQNVSSFVDGLYLQRGYMIDVALTDMERIEVLKGPQSALYGQNAFGGAISYVTRKASNKFEGNLMGTLGSDSRYDLRGAVNVPVIAEVLAVRIGGGLTKFDGSWDNNHPLADDRRANGTTGNIGGYDNWSANASVVLTPADGLIIDGSYIRSVVDAEVRPQAYLAGIRSVNETRVARALDLNCPRGFLWCGALPNSPGEVPGQGVNRDPSPTIHPSTFGQRGTNEIIRASARYALTDALDIMYQFGRVESDILSANQLIRDAATGTPANALGGLWGTKVVVDSQPNGALEATSHEIRFDYKNSGFSALLAGYYYKATDFYSSRLYLVDPATPVTVESSPLFRAASYTILKDKTEAVYGALKYTIDALTLSAEGRSTRERKSRYSAPDPVNGGPQFRTTLPAIPANPDLNPATFSFFTPRLSADYKITDRNLVYASAARGAKAGGFNRRTVLDAEQTYDPEFNWTYELGTKNTLFDGRLTLNGAIYTVKWSGVQTNVQETGGSLAGALIIGNVGNITSYGGEIEAVFRPMRELALNLSLSHDTPRFDDGTVDLQVQRGLWCAPGICNQNGDVSGNALSRAPRTKATAGVDWQAALTDGTDYFIRGDLGYQSRQFVEFTNVGWVPSRLLVNTSVGLETDKWNVQLWAKNLLDEQYASNSLFGGGISYVVSFGDRRTYGVTAGFKF